MNHDETKMRYLDGQLSLMTQILETVLVRLLGTADGSKSSAFEQYQYVRSERNIGEKVPFGMQRVFVRIMARA